MPETEAERRERERREEQERKDADAARLREINEKYDERNPWWSR